MGKTFHSLREFVQEMENKVGFERSWIEAIDEAAMKRQYEADQAKEAEESEDKPDPRLVVDLGALKKQVGGRHYKDFKIQPVEFIHANQIPFAEGNAIKYLCRWRAKGGIADLEKAKHYIEMLIDLETRNAADI